MLVSSHFDFRRFCLLLKRDFFEHKKENLRNYLGFFLGYFLIIFVTTYETIDNPAFHPDTFWCPAAVAISLSTIFLQLLWAISTVFSNLKTKQRRISFFMVPATVFEKYLSRLFQSTVVFWAVIPVAFVAADVVGWAVREALGEGHGLVTPHLVAEIGRILTNDGKINGYVFIPTVLVYGSQITAWLALVGTYLLGGTIFRRQPFILTSLTVFLFIILLVTGIGLLAAFGIDWQERVAAIEVIGTQVKVAPYVFPGFITQIVLSLLWTVFCTWYSYRSFARANAIANKVIGL